MRILFLHYAFPGPFRYLAAHLAAVPGNTVLFASEYDRSDLRLSGVKQVILNKPKPLGRPHDPLKAKATDFAERDICAAVRRGAAAADSLTALRRDGFVPDIIYTSALMGTSFYIRDVFPEAMLAVQADWYYTDEAHSPFSLRKVNNSGLSFAQERVRNLVQLNSLLESPLPVTASECQRKHFPPCVGARMQVMPRGVDTVFFSPGNGDRFSSEACDLSSARELVTFSGRVQEAGRGLLHFLRALPRLFNARPQCHALMLATGAEPARVEKLRRDARTLLGKEAERAHILHFSPLKEYRSILRSSDLHVYLTAPFALSSGLFEAMSCGCLVLGADTEPVREVIRHGENGFLHDFADYQATADVMADMLERAPALAHVREAARGSMLEDYDQRMLVERHADLLQRYHQAWVRGESLECCVLPPDVT